VNARFDGHVPEELLELVLTVDVDEALLPEELALDEPPAEVATHSRDELHSKPDGHVRSSAQANGARELRLLAQAKRPSAASKRNA
jgi:hypothetical protein